MSDATRVMHPTLGAPGEWAAAAPLAAARLTDRQRLAVLLEGAALLSLLERAAWWLPQGWAEARVAAGGRLALPAREAVPGRSPRPVQEQLRELLLRLFGAAGAAAGDPGAAAWSCEAGEEGPPRDQVCSPAAARPGGRRGSCSPSGGSRWCRWPRMMLSRKF